MIEENEVILDGQARKVRVIKCEMSKSKAGNPMLVQTFEIFDSPPFIQNGDTVDINGFTIQNWMGLSEAALGVVNSQRRELGLPTVTKEGLDTIDPSSYLGTEGWAYCRTEKKPAVSEVNQAPIINPHTGEQEVNYRRVITGWPKK